MNKMPFLFLLCALSSLAWADTAPTDIFKVNLINKPKCLEFYRYKNALYCSPTSSTAKPIDTNIINYENLNIIFDEQPWLVAWGNKEDFSFAIQYVPKGDTLENWHEMVTSQFIPRVQASLSPLQYFNRVMENVTNAGYKPTTTVIKDTPDDDIIVEFRIGPPDNLSQDELMRIIKTDNGFYVLHYATHTPDMGVAARTKWTSNLKKSTIIDPYE